MTVSTDGQICYGIRFDEDMEFPWESDEWDRDFEDWWIYEACGYKNPFELFTAQGEWIRGKKPPEEKIDEYYDARSAFRDSHPLPIELVNYCSGDYPMYILAVPSSCHTAHRGYPENFIPSNLSVSNEEMDRLGQFCEKWGLEGGEQGWWLSSYWG